jgi:hypothetical protein
LAESRPSISRPQSVVHGYAIPQQAAHFDRKPVFMRRKNMPDIAAVCCLAESVAPPLPAHKTGNPCREQLGDFSGRRVRLKEQSRLTQGRT